MIQPVSVWVVRPPFYAKRKIVRAIVRRGLALHLNYVEHPSTECHRYYVLTHVRTGYKLARFDDRAIAMAAFKTLAGSFNLNFVKKRLIKMAPSIEAVLNPFLLQDMTDDDIEEMEAGWQ